jgi:hypothetical protein
MEAKIKVEIPDYLVREIIYEQPYHYKNHQKVLTENQTLDGIKGKGRLQSFMSSCLLVEFSQRFCSEYWSLINAGFQLDEKDKIIANIALLKKSDLPLEKIDTHYFEEVPECIIEVDVSIDLMNAENQDYVFQKTQRLLDFGTSQVIWILTKSRKIMVAKPNEAWIVDNWNQEITILDKSFILEDLLKEKGLIQ